MNSPASRFRTGRWTSRFYRDDPRLQAAAAPLEDTSIPDGGHRRRAGDPRRRRPVYRSIRPLGGSTRLPRHRSAPRRAAGSPRRPRAPRAAAPVRLRRQERAPPRAARNVKVRLSEDDGHDGRVHRTLRRALHDETSAIGRRPVPRRGARNPRRRGPVQPGPAGPRGQEAADAARAAPSSRCFYEKLHPHPGCRSRSREKWMSADVINVQRLRIVCVQRGIAARTTALTLRAAGGRRADHPAPRVGAPPSRLAEWTATETGGPTVINAGDGTHEHPTPGAARRADHPAAVGQRRGQAGVVIVGRRPTQSGWRGRTCCCSTRSAPRWFSSHRPRCFRSVVADWPVSVSHDLDAELPIADRGADAASGRPSG